MRRFVFAAFALTVLAACQPADTELTEVQTAEIAAEVNLRMDQLWDVLRQPDWDRMAEFFDQSPDMVMGSDGIMRTGLMRASLPASRDQRSVVRSQRSDNKGRNGRILII